MAETTKKTKEKTEETQLIYCGPSLATRLPKFSVLIGDIKKYTIIEDDLKNCPSIEKLMIPISDYPNIKDKIMEIGTKENVFYKEIEKYLKGSDK